MDDKNKKHYIDDAFKQLDGALCLWARAKGETPLKEYFYEVIPGTCRMILGDNIFEVTLVLPDDVNPVK